MPALRSSVPLLQQLHQAQQRARDMCNTDNLSSRAYLSVLYQRCCIELAACLHRRRHCMCATQACTIM